MRKPRPIRTVIIVGLLTATGCSAPPQSGGGQGTGRPASASAPASQAEQSLEYKLAVVNNGGYVSPGDVTVARFRSLLQQLSSKFSETPERIGDMSVACRDSLKQKGISESILNIMEGMNQVLDAPILSSAGINMQKYPEYLALYVVQRDSGMSHASAIATMRALVR